MDLARRVDREGVCLLRLCADLEQFVETSRSTKTYLSETDAFLNYITKCLVELDKFIRGTIEKGLEEELAELRLRDFGHIKIVLSWLYRLSKEAIDADTLSIPFSLVTFLNHTARQLEQSNDINLVVMGSSELNYFKFNLKPQRKLSERIKESVIAEYPLLSPTIGILKFPYCESSEVLVNCDLVHEVGHYLYETTHLEDQFVNELEDALFQFVEAHSVAEAVRDVDLFWPKLLNYVSWRLLSWADEIFADIFAIAVLGPAFHLGCLEIEQVIPVLTSDTIADIDVLGSTVSRTHEMIRLAFSNTHPAIDFRFRIHSRWLHEAGWDQTLKSRTPEIFAELERCATLEAGRFVVACNSPFHDDHSELENKLHRWMMDTFEGMIPKIEDTVRQLVSHLPKPFDDFQKCDEGVTRCLKHAVVPSTIITNTKERLYPTPTTILNSGFFFYFNGMPGLLPQVEPSEEHTKKRMLYERRLNDWLAKAIDDWQIMRQEGVL